MALTKEQRSAAAKKAARTRKRNAAKPATRRRRKTTKKGFLSEFVSKAETKAGVRAAAWGAVGSIPAIAVDKVVDPNTTQQNRGIIQMGVGLGIAVIGRAPYMGAGTAAIGAYNMLQGTGMMNDNGYELAEYADPIENLPPYLNDNGYELSEEYGINYIPNY